MQFLISCSLLLLILGCTSTQITSDPSLVKSYRVSQEKLRPFDGPYVAKYERNGKILLFLAADHVSVEKKIDFLQQPTMKAIPQLFSEHKPEVVIVEGLKTAEELSPPSILKRADDCASTQYKSCGEPFLAINQARKTQAHYITGEPSELSILNEIRKESVTQEDLMGFYIVRQIPYWKRIGEFKREGFKKQAEEFIGQYKKLWGKTSWKYGVKDFERWYKANVIAPPNYLDFTNQDTAPEGGPEATYVQKISNKVSLIRDRAVVKTIERMLNQFSRVLVVYGGSHLITQAPALEKMMGSPTYAQVPN